MDRNETIKMLMEEYGTAVLHLAYSYVRNRETAEDLTQEIFFKCFERLDTFQGNSAIQTWLYRIAANHCKDYLKSWYHRKMHVSDYLLSFFKNTQAGPEDQCVQEDEKSELQHALFQLPVKYREVIFLYYFQECSQKEISDICGLNLNTVKTRLVRARELLKEILEEGRFEYGGPIEKTKERNAGG